MYKLHFSHQSNVLHNPTRNSVQEIHPTRLRSNDEIGIYVRHGRSISGYKFVAQNSSWVYQWDKIVFEKEGDYPLNEYPWIVTDKLLPGRDVIVLRHPEGIRLYVPDLNKPDLKLLKEDGHFHEVYEAKVYWGRFYPDPNELGVLTRKANGEVKFFVISHDSLWPNTSYPVFPAAIETSKTATWNSPNSELTVGNVMHEQDVFVLRTVNSLELYKFNNDYVLECIFHTNQIQKEINARLDQIYFANLTNQTYLDILHLNTNGLFVYQYNNKLNDYVLLNQNAAQEITEFSETIQIADINNDGKDDFIFTGYNGLTALTFITNNTWKTLLNADQLPTTQKFSNVVGILPPMSPKILETSLFLQDLTGNIQWAKVIPDNESNTMKFNLATATPANNVLSHNEIPERQNVVIPKQIPRSTISEKPFLRWSEQWGGSFLSKAVDLASGQVRFGVPLADLTASTGWGIKLALLYNSDDSTANQLGIGWSMSITPEYIYVDHQGSVFSEDAQYYLMLQGRPQSLKLLSTTENTQIFQITDNPDDDITIKYNISEETWTIENEAEQTIYGKTKNSLAKEILQWSLEWPNWRGSGTNKAELKPVIQAWYINTRLDKQNGNALHYYYETDKKTLSDGKSYTSAIRLKAIKSNQQLEIIFTYSKKYDVEYTNEEPTDNKGNIRFPISIVEKHYFDSIYLITSSYQQKFLLRYEVNNKSRFLKSIQQEFASGLESLLKFNYKSLYDERMMVSCTTTRITVNFEYKSIVPLFPSSRIQFTPIHEKPKISYGSDFAIMAYREPSSKQVIFHVKNRDLTKTNVKITLSIPEYLSIEDLKILSYNNSFSVLMTTKEKYMLYLYTRKEKIWSIQDKIYNFDKKSLPYFGETIIVFWEQNSHVVKIIDYVETEFAWTETNISLSSSIKYFAIHKKLITGYNDNHLWLFYKDKKKDWQKRLLKSNLGNPNSIVDRFELDVEFKEQWTKGIQQISLQILNNFIVLSSMQENNKRIYSHIHVLLLDANHNVVKYRHFVEERENILELSENFEYEKSTYTLKYYIKNNKINLKITAASGEVVKHVDKIHNKNLKQDAMNDRIKLLNESEGWQSLLRRKVIFNSNLYRIQISYEGVSCGDDILYRFTGTDWNKENSKKSSKLTLVLGKYFILESTATDKVSLILYKQDNNKQKQGPALKQIDASGTFVNNYPFYIAYQKTPDEIEVITFRNGKILDKIYTYQNEELLSESDWKNILTFKNTSTSTLSLGEPFQLITRPITKIISPEKKVFVKEMTLFDGSIERKIGYDLLYNNQRENSFVETIKIIPAANTNISGWTEITRTYDINTGNITKTEDNFDSKGQLILIPLEHESSEDISNERKSSTEKNPMILYDRNGKLVISNFSPYIRNSGMVDYYGFETYEAEQLNFKISEINSTEHVWRVKNAKIISNGFAFTGKNYLEINSSAEDVPGFIEKVFKPQNQDVTYMAACWIRCNASLDLYSAAAYLKATIKTTTGQKIITMLGQVKQRYGDWYYLELPIDFETIHQMYEEYLTHMFNTSTNNSVNAFPPANAAQFNINLRIESIDNKKLDVDHIRFTPMSFDFEAVVYDSLTRKQTATIQANGLVTRTIYNNFQEEIVSFREDGQIEQFVTRSKSGCLFTSSKAATSNQNPNNIIFQPVSGFYETFDTFALRSRWTLENSSAWNIAPGQIWHKDMKMHRLEADPRLFDSTNAAIRMNFALQLPQAALSLLWHNVGEIKIVRETNGAALLLPNNVSLNNLPINGELIVMLEENYIWLWIDGVLLIDQVLPRTKFNVTKVNPFASFALEVYGQVLVEDLLVMNSPSVQVEYFNSFGDKTQVIQLENAQSILVTETIYDEIGREAIITKTTRINRQGAESLLKQRLNFVSNTNHSSENSVWRTGKLLGEIDQLNPEDQGFAYRRTEFELNPLNEEKAIGLPGADFAITGKYATKKSQHSGIPFLSNLFPSKRGFRQKVVDAPNGTKKVTVFDKFKNQVAQYIQVPSYNHLLSTYEYDSEKRLVKILPPLYHEKVSTSTQITPWQSGEDHLSIEQKQWQHLLATNFIYNENGNLIRKKTPDTGITEYLYNSLGQMRFMVSLKQNNETDKIVYYDYGDSDELIRTGYINVPLPLSSLKEHLESINLPYSEEYQLFDYSDKHPNPTARGNIKQLITFNSGEPVIEMVKFNSQQQIVEKNMILDRNDNDKFKKIKKDYIGNKMSTLTYPPIENDQQLKLFHRYNKLGQLISIGTAENSSFVDFTYNANDQIDSEHHHLNNFTRRYHYNSPGFLEILFDPFLTEHLSYSDNGYGHSGYGDGMMMQTTFNATWPLEVDGRWFQLREGDIASDISAKCLRALKRTGYISNINQPLKLYVRDMETRIPLECDGNIGNHISKLIAEKMMPQYYGYRYAYGNHQELVKAKYFSDEATATIGPLQHDTFTKEISGINRKQSRHIWKILSENNYIITDNLRNDANASVGLQERSFFKDESLMDDLKSLDGNFILYIEPIKKLILKMISKRKKLRLDEFEDIFLSWEGVDQTSNIMQVNLERNKAKMIGNMLLKKGYFDTETSQSYALEEKFTLILKDYSDFIPDIIKVLLDHFANVIGTTAFDVESYKIDANGNHRLFWTGFNRHELIYENSTNKIETVITNSFDNLHSLSMKENYPMKHDVQGNVIHASYKGIEKIEYHPVSQRTMLINLTDGRSIRYYYDAQGERVLKQVFSADGDINYERQYLRDEKGRVLADRVIRHFPKETKQVVTGYLYGPRGLLGFIRNNQFYSVTTDHIGSIRLIIRDGKVVAAYDYLPYGQLMRSYGNDPDAHIVFRYTGQEWDEETNLYNFHARLYDPSIGRFYQPDPMSQYFSPYKYAGNSPVAFVDPDGEFAFMILFAILFAIGGAYLGGAAANNRWNPADWDFSDAGTYLGIGVGALAGFFLPIGAVASVGTIGIGATILLGSGGAYLMTAAANDNWNPAKWKWDRPGTWNAVFQGFGAGSGLAGGVGMAHNFAGKIFGANKLGKILFLGVSYSAGAGVTYGAGVMANDGTFAFWKWDWANPGTWAALVDGFDSGMGWPQGVLEIGRGLAKISKSPKLLGNLLGKNTQKWNKFKAILKNPKHPLYKVAGGIVMSYFMGSSANGEFDITCWSLASFSTYEGIINGVFSGKDTISMIKFARQTKLQQPNVSIKKAKKNNNLQNYSKNIVKQLDNIKNLRQQIEYVRLMHDFFSDGGKLSSKLQNNIKSSAQSIKKFFKQGEDKWKKGESKPPKELDKLLIKEADDHILSSSKDLIDWRQNMDQLTNKQKEILPESEIEFLNCRTLGRRRRNPDKVCTVPQKKKYNEILENYFDIDVNDIITDKKTNFGYIDPTSKRSYSAKNYAEKLSFLLDSTPTVLVGSKSNFLSDFIIGSLLTNPSSGLTHTQIDVFVKNDQMKFSNSRQKQFDHSVLKTCFKTDIKGETLLVLKAYINEPSYISIESKNVAKHYQKIFLEQLDTDFKYSKSEIDDITQKLGITGDFKIREEVFYLDKENKLHKNEKISTASNYDYNTGHTGISEFRKVESVFDSNLENHLNKLSNADVDVVKNGIEGLSNDLLEIFNKNQDILELGKKVSESRFHAFLYGALSMNFQNRYNLDVFVERISGRGYSDLLLLSRKDTKRNKNWNAIPIVFELKSDGTSAKSAINQALGTSYLYNLSLRTVAEKALIVGINSQTSKVEAIPVEVPVVKNFVKELLEHPGNKEIIETALQNIYNSISPAAIKTSSSENDHYLSRLLTGELLGTSSTQQYVHYHTEGDFKNKLTTFLYKDAASDEWIMLNVIENSVKRHNDYFYDPVDVQSLKLEIPPHLDIKSFTRIDIKLNNRSKAGWSIDQPKRTDEKVPNQNKNIYFLQDIKVEKVNVIDGVNSVKSDKYKELISRNVNEIFDTEQSMIDRSELSNRFLDDATFTENLKQIKDSINSESDFQAIFQGLLMANSMTSDGAIIKVFPEANPSAAGRIDLVISKLRKINADIFEEHLVIIELKYAETSRDVEAKLIEGYAQVLKYKNNLKTFTDLKVYTPLAVVFNKETGTIRYRAHPISEVLHYSDSESDSSSSYISQGIKRVKLTKRSIHNVHQENISMEYHHNTTKVNSLTRVSSGSSRLQFWPVHLIQKTQSTFLSIITALWIAAPAEKYIPNSKEEYWTQQEEIPYETTNPTPSILEMGDKWLQSTDLNSNLTLGILIARKLTGYRPKPLKYNPYDYSSDVELNLKATYLVYEFMEMVVSQARASELNQFEYDLFENSSEYFSAIRMVHHKLTIGEIDRVPQQLYEHIVAQNLKHFTSSSKIIQFVDNVTKNLNKWSQEYLYLDLEQEQFRLQCPVIDRYIREYSVENNVFKDELFLDTTWTKQMKHMKDETMLIK